MDKHIPYEKLNKKQKQALNAQRRVTWGFSPVTRKPVNSKAYNRAKARSWKNHRDRAFFICSFCASRRVGRF